MNKSELLAAMAESSGLSKRDCENALNAFTEAVEQALRAGDKINWLASVPSR